MGAFDWTTYRAVLFDLDGVVTPTASVHMSAWTEMFNGFLRLEYGPNQAPFTLDDYHAYVDGKPRYDGVRSFLASRSITVDEAKVTELGDIKNEMFHTVLARDGVAAYPGSRQLLDYLATLKMPLAIVSSSANAPAVLAAAGMTDRFVTIVDGNVARELGLAGKPDPATFLYAAEVLGVSAADSVVLEDAVSGVAAGKSGGFATTIGVDRGAGAALTEAGADFLVTDLADLVPDVTVEEVSA